MKQHILALDEGTTSARAILYTQEAKPIAIGQHEFTQIYPRPGWVEHNPEEIWRAQQTAIKDTLNQAKIEPSQITCIGITNQRETTIVWDKKTGTPITNAIVWQCRRTAEQVEETKKQYGELVKEKTGLVPDSYFSAPKIKWILENILGAREKADRDELLFGTIDTYLIHKLTEGKTHVTDPGNASRTLLYNIKEKRWDPELLEIFCIPESMLPEVKPSSGLIAYTDPEVFGAAIPITGCAGDQQAALFGHTATKPGDSKCTYGTGNFLLMNTGDKPVESETLLTTIAWNIAGETTYALEGSIFTTGAAIQWLRDGLKIITAAEETETLANSLPDNQGVYMVPAFTGLGAPHWNQQARGIITGITRGTTRAHIARAALESIAYQTHDLVDAMQQDSKTKIKNLRVDGGATHNRFLMQFQADILGIPIIWSHAVEATARGAALLAGIGEAVWEDLDEITDLKIESGTFTPEMRQEERQRLLEGWRKALTQIL